MDTEAMGGTQGSGLIGYQIERYLSFAGFVFGGALVLIVAWSSYRNVETVTREVDQIHHSLLVRQEADATLALLGDAATDQLAFLLTGDPATLDAYNESVRSFPSHMSRLGELTRDNPTQQSDLWRFSVLSAARLAEMDEGIRARKEQGLPAAQQIVQSSRNKEFQAESRSLISSILQQNTLRDTVLESSVARGGRNADAVIFGGLGFALAMIVGAGFLLSHANRRRDWEQFGQGTFWSLLALRSGSLPRGPRPTKRPPDRSASVKEEPAPPRTGGMHIAELL